MPARIPTAGAVLAAGRGGEPDRRPLQKLAGRNLA